MAAQERIPGDTQPQRKRACYDSDALDIDLLCAKLETAKREREEREAASRLRKQVRESVKHSNTGSQHSERPQLSKKSSTNDGSKRSSWYKLPNKFRQSLSVLNVNNIPEHGPVEPIEPVEEFDLISPVLDSEEREIIQLSRGSTPDENFDRRPEHLKVKRSSYTVLKRFTTNDREQLRRIGNSNAERPGSKHRSQTVPLLKSKWWSSRQDLIDVSQYKDSCRPSDEEKDVGAFVNEYTISFDTCEVHGTIQHQADGTTRPTSPTVERPKWVQNEGMRSLLNLASVLKKDKNQSRAQVDEIPEPITNDEDDPMTRRPHTRSQTAPEGFFQDAATKPKKEKKAKKRRSVGGLLQSVFAPNHSMSMHQVTI